MNHTILNLDYQQVISVTQHPLMLLAMISILFVFIIVFILIGFIAKAKTGSGRVVLNSSGKPIRSIQSLNFWILFISSLFIIIGLTFILIVYPIWILVL